MEFRHRSVLLEETIERLKIKPDGIYLDGTLGGGGHSSEILRRLQGGHLIGIDQDEEALEAAGRRLSEFGEEGKNFTLIRDNYCNAAESLTMRNAVFPIAMMRLLTCGWITDRPSPRRKS